MKIEADRSRCEGHAMCEALLPEVFQLGDDAVVEVLAENVPDMPLADVQLAVDACPVQALRLVN